MTGTDKAPVSLLRWPILLASPALLLWAYLWMPDFDEFIDEAGYMLRATARVAFVFLMLAYVARPLQHITDKSRALLTHRRYLACLWRSRIASISFMWFSGYRVEQNSLTGLC